MPLCTRGCRQFTVDNTRCSHCHKFCCKGCLVLVERGRENCLTSLCPECSISNNNDEAGDTSTAEFNEIEPDKVVNVRSAVWKDKFFKGNRITGKVDKSRVYCRECIKDGKFLRGIAYAGTTSNLRDHDVTHHGAELSEKDKTGMFGFTSNRSEKKWEKSSSQWKKTTKALVRWLVLNSRPSHLVQDRGFRDFIALVCPEYEVPSDKTIANYIEELYREKVNEVKSELQKIEFVAVTSDGGSSINQISFQDENVHYINDDFELKVKTLAVRENKEEKTAEHYREINDEVLEEFGISQEQVCQYVTDSENKMRAAFPTNRSGCVSHAIHNTVKEGLKNPVAAKSLDKLSGITTKHNQSCNFRYQLEREQKKLGLKLKKPKAAVETRWGSTKEMIGSYMSEDEDDDKYFQAANKALMNLAEKTKKKEQRKKFLDLKLSNSDISKLKATFQLLQRLDIACTALGTKQVSSSLVLPVVETIKTDVLRPDEENDHQFIEDMKKEMLDDFTKRIADTVNMEVMRKASLLDPREKKLLVMENKKCRKLIQKKVLSELKSLESQEPDGYVENENIESKEPDAKRKKFGISYAKNDASSDSDGSFDNDPMIKSKIEKEWEAYLAEDEVDYDTNPLSWYKDRKDKYPNVIRLAK